MNRRTAEILLVEDSEADALLTEEALREVPIRSHLHRVPDGAEAIEFIEQRGRYADAPHPDLILLDLNLPKMTGHEVLERLKNDPKLRIIPVVILSTSEREEDVLRSYQRHANCYVTKPVNLNAFFERVQSLANFWLRDATLTHS